MAPPPDDEHDCGWKAYAKAQEQKLDELTAKLAAVTAKLQELERRGPKTHRSERRKRGKKMPPPIPPETDPEETAKKRRAAEELRRTKLETEVVHVPVPPEACKCPRCGSDELRCAGSKPSTVYEYIPSYFRRRIIKRETRSCVCGYIVTAPPPVRVSEKTRYAPSFIAHPIVTKCSSSMPQGKRTRAGCLAHARRKIFDNSEHPEAKEALDLVGDIYRIEQDGPASSARTST